MDELDVDTATAALDGATSVRTCSSCGAPLRDGARFCASCGNWIGAEPAVEVADEPEAVEEPEPAEDVEEPEPDEDVEEAEEATPVDEEAEVLEEEEDAPVEGPEAFLEPEVFEDADEIEEITELLPMQPPPRPGARPVSLSREPLTIPRRILVAIALLMLFGAIAVGLRALG
jgi:uncharacterized Zn finger protein (UPF0148 family)